MNVDQRSWNQFYEVFARNLPEQDNCNCKYCVQRRLATASDDGTKESTTHYHKPKREFNNPSPAKRTIAMPGELYENNMYNIKPKQYSDEEEIESRDRNNSFESKIQNFSTIKRKQLQKREEFLAEKYKAGISVTKNADEPVFTSGSEETVIYNDDTFRHENGDKVNKLQVPDLNALTYEVERFSRNAMIIFNHEHFSSQTRRAGTDRDVIALEQTFKRFRFEVTIHNDLNKKPLFEELQKFGKQNFEDCGCICVAILTHGNDHGYLRAADMRYNERELFACLDTQENPTLVAKPVIFLIQACRGNHLAGTNLIYQSGEPVLVELDTEIKNQSRYLLPTEADMIIFHSCFIGRASVRVVSEGTWFVQTICEQLNLYASTEHLEEIFQRVRKIIALEKGYENAKQMPVMSSTLLRKLYLLPQSNSRAKDYVNYPYNPVGNVRFNASHDAIQGKIYLVAENAFIGIALTIVYCCLLYVFIGSEGVYIFLYLSFIFFMRPFDVLWKKMLASLVLLIMFFLSSCKNYNHRTT